MEKLYIKLDEQDFRSLVSGGIITIKIPKAKQEIFMCLSDIGFESMDNAIEHAALGIIRHYSNLEKTNDTGWIK